MKYKIYITILTLVFLNLVFASDKTLHEKYSINAPKLSEPAKVNLLSQQKNQVEEIEQFSLKNNPSVSLMNKQSAQQNLVKINNDQSFSFGNTFTQIPFSEKYDIDQLTKSETQSYFNRDLFGSIEKSATYYKASYYNSAPFVKSVYLEFVIDPAWDRILYGNLDYWIKSLDNIKGASDVEIDATGRVFIGSTTDNKINVYQINGDDADNVTISQIFTIDGVYPTDISLNDNGTAFNISDDFLFYCDASSNKVLKYKLYDKYAEKISVYNDFDNPSNILCGKVNGVNNNLIYVIDKVAQRIRLFENTQNKLKLLKILQGDHSNYFTAIKNDYFGNVYITDLTENSISKYTFDLEFLDKIENSETNNSVHFVNIPFGTIEIEGEGTYRTGFDQMFAVQNWSEEKGISRFRLGTRLKDINYFTDEYLSKIYTAFTLTDASEIDYRIFDSNNHLVKIISNEMMQAGYKNLYWDRKNESGEFISPGNYLFELNATSPYTEENLSARFETYIPLCYWQDCGSSIAQNNSFLIQGENKNWGENPSETVSAHPTNVLYKFENLNPESDYEIQAEYYAGDKIQRTQTMTSNGLTIHNEIKFSDKITNTGFIQIPEESYESGSLVISINSIADGDAVVSQLWLKETGNNFSVTYLDENIPDKFELLQNYPNPFNPSTTIAFNLPASQKVSLIIYNVLGEEIATLINGYKDAGNYKVTFNGQKYASGLYFYQLKAGNLIQNKKMILIK